MGVNGLLQILKEIQEPCNLSKYKGQTLAIDTYGWLHRGLISCAQELCQDIPTKKYVNSVMKKVDMLKYYGVEPFLVFDGSYLPTKADTALERKKKRMEAKEKADSLIKQGKRSLAFKEFMKAAGVTPEMAKSIMVELDLRGIKYVVAPYEADPQMVYLEKSGIVDGIISEDSDLLIFGCNKLITKLNDFGDCVEINRDNFHKVKKINKLHEYTQEQLRSIAILSGCDYTKGIAGVGLITAFSMVRRYGTLQKTLTMFRNEGKCVTKDYEEEANRANIAFQYQKVFDPKLQCITTLNEEPQNFDKELHEICCGKTLDVNVQRGICTGKLHPNTYEVLLPREQSLSMLKSVSMNESQSSTTIVAQKSKSLSKGSIDSFFTKKEAKVVVAQDSPFVAKNIVKCPSLQQPTRVLKRKDTNISTSSKKLKAFAASIVPNMQTSNFFKQNKLNNCQNGDISGDSDIPDEFSSSPVKVEQQKEIPFMHSIDNAHNLSQKINIDIKHENQYEQKKDKNDYENENEDEDEDEIIEESPVKSKNSSNLAQSLREKFSMTSKYEPKILSKKSIIKSKIAQVKYEDDEISEDDEHIEAKKITLTPLVKPQQNTTFSVNLQKFAFRS